MNYKRKIQIKFCISFLKKIILNLKKSKNVFFKNNCNKLYYKEAYKEIKKIINFLASKKKNKIVVFSDKSANYYLIVLSIILSGKTWIQISPNIPLKRIKKILKISNANIGIYDESFGNKKQLNALNIPLWDIKNILKSFVPIKIIKLNKIKPENDAMIFFTSGSTSFPKGVKITYHSFIYSAFQQIKNLNYKDNNSVFSDYHDTSFVMSLNIIFPAVYSNSTISPLIEYTDKINPIEHIKTNKISILITVPSFFLYINNFIKKKIFIKKVIFCGECFSYNIFKLLKKKIFFNELYNCYGSTELSPWAYFYKYKNKDNKIIKKYNQLPIGSKFVGLNSIVNSQNELCISGPVLSKGYVLKKKNKGKFFSYKKKLYYNTGDVCEILNNKYTFITGRNDKQIKIKGYRINILEIENYARKVKGIEFAMCFKKANLDTLVLIVFSKSITYEFFLENLKSNLPKYMIPQNIILKKQIKLNKNGKIDRTFYKEKYR